MSRGSEPGLWRHPAKMNAAFERAYATRRLPGQREQTEGPRLRAFSKRLMGLEPTTFCMASRRSSQLSYSRIGPKV